MASSARESFNLRMQTAPVESPAMGDDAEGCEGSDAELIAGQIHAWAAAASAAEG